MVISHIDKISCFKHFLHIKEKLFKIHELPKDMENEMSKDLQLQIINDPLLFGLTHPKATCKMQGRTVISWKVFFVYSL